MVDDVDVEVVGQQLVALLAVAMQHGEVQLGEVAEYLVAPSPLQCGQGADNQHALDQTQLLEVVKGPQDADRLAAVMHDHAVDHEVMVRGLHAQVVHVGYSAVLDGNDLGLLGKYHHNAALTRDSSIQFRPVVVLSVVIRSQ